MKSSITALILASGISAVAATKTVTVTIDGCPPEETVVTKSIPIAFGTSTPSPVYSSSECPISTATYCPSNGVYTIPVVETITPANPQFTEPATTTVYYTKTVTGGAQYVDCTTVITVVFTSTYCPEFATSGSLSTTTPGAPASTSATTSAVTSTTVVGSSTGATSGIPSTTGASSATSSTTGATSATLSTSGATSSASSTTATTSASTSIVASTTTGQITTSTIDPSADPSSDPEPTFAPKARSLNADVHLASHKAREQKLRRGGLLTSPEMPKEKRAVVEKRSFALKKPFGL